MTVLLTGLLALFGGSSFLVSFRFEDLLQHVLLAAAVGTATSWLLTGLWRRGPSIATVAGLALLAGAGVLSGSFEAAGVRDGPMTIVQAPAPVPAGALELTVPYVAVGLAALLGGELAQRSRTPVVPLLPSLAVLLAGLILGGDGQELPLWGPFAWTAAALVLVGWRSRPADRPDAASASSRRSTFTAPTFKGLAARGGTLVAVAVLLAVGAGAVGHQVLADQDRDRFVLEDPEEPEPATDDSEFNPLTRVTSLHDGPNDSLFDVDTSAPIDRWRLAVLDTYDGQAWTSDQSFVPAGRELPPLPPLSAPEPEFLDGEPTEIDQVVEPTAEGREQLGSRLPVTGRPVELDSDDLLFQNESGTLAADGELPDRYGASSEVVWPDPARLAEAEAADDSEARAALQLPEEVPEELEELADQLTDGVDSAQGRALALEGYFTALELAYEEPPSGHSFGHLKYFLFESESPRGSPEQFAASYAVLARLAGLPSRVVVGFHGLGAAGEHSVTSHTATAWVEVKFEGAGWVAFDPVPALPSEVAPPGDDEVAGSDEPVPEDEDEDEELDDETEEDADSDEKEAEEAASGSNVPWIGGGLLALVGLGIAAPALRRAWRRRHHRRGDGDTARIVGAWEATLDVLRTAGVPVGEDLGALDVVAVSRPELAGDSLGRLGNLVNWALFAATQPGDKAAAQAWSLRDEIARTYRRTRSRRQALRDYFTGR